MNRDNRPIVNIFSKTALVGSLMVVLVNQAAAGLPVAVGGMALPSLAPMLETVQPAVVNISTTSYLSPGSSRLFQDPFFRQFFDLPERRQRSQKETSLGSGVIFDANAGYVVTNVHVIEGADEIRVTLADGRQLNAEVVGLDAETDIAVIKIPAKKLKAIRLGNSSRLRVGDFVVAIGNPFGLNQTVTSGIVSALGRTGLGIEGYEDFIQTDASINPGNSGGPLVDLNGELIGLNTAIFSKSGGNIGIGFAIPVDMVKKLVVQLVQFGEVKRGQLGVIVQDLTPELAQAFNLSDSHGAVIARVLEGSAADSAGLRAGDIVLELDHQRLRNGADLRNGIGLMRVGKSIQLKLIRNGVTRDVNIQLSEARAETSEAGQTIDGGRLHRRLDGALLGQHYSDQYPNEGGVVIVEIEKGSAGARVGLEPGDLIVSVNRREITTLSEMEQAVRINDKSLRLNIHRGNSVLFLELR